MFTLALVLGTLSPASGRPKEFMRTGSDLQGRKNKAGEIWRTKETKTRLDF